MKANIKIVRLGSEWMEATVVGKLGGMPVRYIRILCPIPKNSHKKNTKPATIPKMTNQRCFRM